MCIKIFFISMFAGMFLLASCKKGSEPTPQPTPFKFESLTADATEIVFSINPSTKITAVATGDGLKYYWSATAGDILGSGDKVTYTATPACCGGGQRITCKVKDKYGNFDVKQVYINVRN
jgi:hypothetical protein